MPQSVVRWVTTEFGEREKWLAVTVPFSVTGGHGHNGHLQENNEVIMRRTNSYMVCTTLAMSPVNKMLTRKEKLMKKESSSFWLQNSCFKCIIHKF